jgi:peptidyl-prolyl cis-trans isomerase D
MFEFVRTHNRLLFFVLVLLIFPSFVFFGVQGYSQFNDQANDTVARVDGQKITRAEWDGAHRRQIEQARSRMPDLDPKFFDAPEVRRETLDQLVRERVLFAAASRGHLSVSDERLVRELQSIPQLAALRRPDGSFDVAAYKVMIESQGRSTEAFESGLRQELALRQVTEAIAGTATGTGAPGRLALDALLQQREAQVLRFDPQEQRAAIDPSEAELAAYHKANENAFRTPERARIEVVLLDVKTLEPRVAVPEAELRKYYEENASRWTAAEERRASHILVQAPKDAPAAERDKARTKAQALLDGLRKAPGTFAEVAKKSSDDAGSAERGGDLDFFARGAMVKPFEDAVFAMKPGEISNLVDSEFGFHIIRLDAVRGGERKPFEAVRAEIEAEVRRSLAAKDFAAAAEQFGNLVNAQADSLKPVADKLGLEVVSATVQRTPQPGAAAPLNSPKLLEAVFAPDALKNKLNTEAIEVGTNQLASARVVEHFPERLQPLAEVRTQVRERVVAEQAAERARKAGLARLEALRKGEAAPPNLSPPLLLSRVDPKGQPRELVDAVLRADADKLPQWVGADLGAAGYAIARVGAVKTPAPDAPEVTQLLPRYAQAWSAAEAQAYLKALERRFKARVESAAATVVGAPAN